MICQCSPTGTSQKHEAEVPSNPIPNLSQQQLKILAKLLSAYAKHIEAEQPLAAQIIRMIYKWVDDDIE